MHRTLRAIHPPAQDVLGWIIANRDGVITGAIVALVIVAIMLVLRFVGQRMVSSEERHAHFSWRSVIGRMLARTSILFMIVAAIDVALQATRAALEEGIVPGGGVALLRATEAIKIDALDGDEQTGAKIILRALEEPVRQIAQNSGFEGSVVVNDVRNAGGNSGLNADSDTGEMTDLIAAGVIDPAMVTRSALQNAASIAKNILTTEAIVAEMPEKDGGGMPAGMPGGMDGMM